MARSPYTRRHFLKSSLTAAGAVMPPQIVRAETLGSAAKSGANSRSGKALRWGPAAQPIVGSAALKAMQDRPRRQGYEMPAV